MRAIFRRSMLAAAALSLAAAACSHPQPHPVPRHYSQPYAVPRHYRVIKIQGPQKGNGPPGLRFGDIPVDYSPHWAGYEDWPSALSVGEDFSWVQAYFTVPRLDAAQCLTHPTAQTAFWVGLGGVSGIHSRDSNSNSSIEQIGVEAACQLPVVKQKDGTYADKYLPENLKADSPAYLMWWESLPADPFFSAPVSPGDSMFASVSYNDLTRTYTGNLADLTQHFRLLMQYQRCTVTKDGQFASDPNTSCNRSAEVIAEVPLLPNGVIPPTAPFKSVPFWGAGVQNNAGESGSLTANTWDPHESIMGQPGSELLVPSSIGQGEGCQPHPGYPAVCFGQGPTASVFDVSNPNYAPAPPSTPSPSPSPTHQCTGFSSACPDGPNNGSPPAATPSASVMPGFSTPQDAVDGFYQGELAGNWSAVCSYVVPSAQSVCLAGTSGQGAATGSIGVDRAVIQGTEALVAVTGNICAPSTPCTANTDPSLGMPTSASDFSAVYQAAVASGSSGEGAYMSPMPCTQVNGKWYVAFG